MGHVNCIKTIRIALTQENLPTFRSLYSQSDIEASVNENEVF